MPIQTQECRIILAIEAIRSSKKLSRRKAAKLYNVPESTLRTRMNGIPSKANARNASLLLTEIEEKAIIQRILDLNTRGFPPRLAGVEDMANLLLETRRARRVGKRWAEKFVKRQPELKMRFNRGYDFQRVLCEDPKLIGDWFELVRNMKTKYGILDCDFYNFDETGFMMGVICASMVVTRADRRGRGKQVQPGNREWATAIECINAEGWCLPPFLVIQGAYHLANWYTECNLPDDWAIKPTSNGWTDNETGLQWIKHFDKHTLSRTKGAYRMLVIDGHESHQSAEFESFCKDNKIITICLPSHASHLVQPLDVGCFGPLKRAYGRQLEDFIKSSITHITKTEFFIAFQAAHVIALSKTNIQAGFRASGLLPFDPDMIISKLDICVRLVTPPPQQIETTNWVSQTPQNASEAISQSSFIQERIAQHQGSSPTPIFTAVDKLVKGTNAIAASITLLADKVRTLRNANNALSKRRRAKKTHIQHKGMLNVRDAHNLLAQKEADEQLARGEREGKGRQRKAGLAPQRCGNCGETGHNVRTYQVDAESAEESDSEYR